MTNDSVSNLKRFLYTCRFFDQSRVITHMYFGNKIYKLNIPTESYEDFLKSYTKYCKEESEETLRSKGLNCLSEKTAPIFRFFADLELNIEDFSEFIDYKDVPELMKTTQTLFTEVLYDAFGKHFECISAFRMFYKCHLYFPDVIVNVEKARLICTDVQKRLAEKYPWISSSDKSRFIDTSVYKSGLRMLFSHKGSLEKADNQAKHESFFKNGPPYEFYYKIGNILNDCTIEYLQDQCTFDTLSRCTILCPPSSIELDFIDTYKPVTKEKHVLSRPATLKRQRLDDQESNVSDNIDQPAGKLVNMTELKELVRDYLDIHVSKTGVKTGFTNVTVNDYGSILVVLEPQMCPFVLREHKRTSEKNVSATYIVLNAFDCTLRCFDEACKDMVSLPSPNENLLEFLCNSTEDYVLKKSLYKPTHENVSEYVFSLVKDRYATSNSKDSGGSSFLWYYYDETEHHWTQQEKIMTTIMESRGIVQTGYRQFIQKIKNDRTIDEKDVKNIKKLWDTLETSLQTTGFVRGGLLPVLARKLEQYWSRIIKNVTHSLKQGKGASFQSTLDDNPDYMGFKNGVWDFRKREFRNGNPLDFISMSTNLVYKSYKEFPEEMKDDMFAFLKKIYPKGNHLNYVLGEIASCLNGTSEQQRFFLMTGRGANGKSTLVRMLNLSLGDYAGEVNITLFTKPRPPPNAPCPELIAIKGQRFVSSSEPNARDPFNLGTIKWLTGGDRITAAQKYEKNQSFYLQATFFSLTNDIPPINASKGDYGTWRRMKPVEHYSRFVRDPDPNNPFEFQDDPLVNVKMESWKELFISYLIEVFLQNKIYKVPEEFVQAHLKLQGDSDIFSRFVDQFVINTEDNFMDVLTVFEAFSGWNRVVKISKRDVNINLFEKHMLTLLGPYVEDDEGNKGWNITLKKMPTVFF